MDPTKKIIVIIFNAIFLFFELFVFQRLLDIGADVKFLNGGVALLISGVVNYIIWNQNLNFAAVLKFAIIFGVSGFLLGIAYIAIFDPNDAQGVFLAFFFTGPIGWLLGSTIGVLKERMSLSRKKKDFL